MPNLGRKSALTFVAQLRSARLTALADAEAFDGIIHAIERLGAYLSKETIGDEGEFGNMEKYKRSLRLLLEIHPCSQTAGGPAPTPTSRFDTIFPLVQAARNDAVHQGAFARHLTQNAIELAVILEDAMKQHFGPTVSDFMIPNPLCAELWHQVGYVRQQMLANSFSFLPVEDSSGEWKLVSESAVVRFLGAERTGEARRKKLAKTLEESVGEAGIALIVPGRLIASDPIENAVVQLESFQALLVFESTKSSRPSGLLTAYDLL